MQHATWSVACNLSSGRSKGTCLRAVGESNPGADLAGLAQSRGRCGSGGPSPGADVGGGEPSPGPFALGRSLQKCERLCTIYLEGNPCQSAALSAHPPSKRASPPSASSAPPRLTEITRSAEPFGRALRSHNSVLCRLSAPIAPTFSTH